MIDQKALSTALSRAACHYPEAAFVQQEIAQRLLERLEYMLIAPQRVLNIGAGQGCLKSTLLSRFPEAMVFSQDVVPKLLKTNVQGVGLCSLLELLPFADQSMDCIISNSVMQNTNDLTACLQECYRVLRPGGLLLVTLFGRDTLCELRDSFSERALEHVRLFYDMHDVGDCLVQCGLKEPVMEMETLTVEYQSLSRLFDDLKAMGARNILQGRRRGCMGKIEWREMLSAYEAFRQGAVYPATVEVIYGHAWKTEVEAQAQEFTVSVDEITRRDNG